jgi:hypothetical protein
MYACAITRFDSRPSKKHVRCGILFAVPTTKHKRGILTRRTCVRVISQDSQHYFRLARPSSATEHDNLLAVGQDSILGGDPSEQEKGRPDSFHLHFDLQQKDVLAEQIVQKLGKTIPYGQSGLSKVDIY